jgi:pimeloyl-ACP methyl ester carboxylesterase
METRSRRVSAPDGRSLEVIEGGDRSGWPIVVHHGTPLSGNLYGPHVQYARDHHLRLIGYSRPGYGASDPLPGRRVADATSDVVAIADALELPRFGVWGHSGGGNHALACAAMLGERVTAAAASAAVAPFTAEGLDWLSGMGSANVDEFSAALAGRDHLEKYLYPQWVAMRERRSEISAELMTLLSPEDFDFLLGELGTYIESASRAGVASGMAGWVDDDLEDVSPWGFELSRIRCPVSIWHGKRDRFVPFSHAIWLSRHTPGSELKLLEEETHLTFFHRRVFEVFDWLLARGVR